MYSSSKILVFKKKNTHKYCAYKYPLVIGAVDVVISHISYSTTHVYCLLIYVRLLYEDVFLTLSGNAI